MEEICNEVFCPQFLYIFIIFWNKSNNTLRIKWGTCIRLFPGVWSREIERTELDEWNFTWNQIFFHSRSLKNLRISRKIYGSRMLRQKQPNFSKSTVEKEFSYKYIHFIFSIVCARIGARICPTGGPTWLYVCSI